MKAKTKQLTFNVLALTSNIALIITLIYGAISGEIHVTPYVATFCAVLTLTAVLLARHLFKWNVKH